MIFQGNQDVLVPAHLNFSKYVLDRVREFDPNNICLQNCDTGEKLTCGEFLQHAVDLAVALSELGVKKGDLVGIASEKRNEVIPTGLAITCIGAVAIPYELYGGRAALHHKLSIAKPKYLICSRSFWEKYKDMLQSLEFIKTFIGFDDIDDIKLSMRSLITKTIDVETFEPAFVHGYTHTAYITYSSGTTGMPKGVQLTHYSCMVSSASVQSAIHDDKNTKIVYVIGEWSDVYDIFVTFKCICAGKTVLYSHSAAPEIVLKFIQDYKAHMAYLAPCTIAYLADSEDAVNYDLSSLNTICCGGSYLHVATIEKIRKRLQISARLIQAYGTNEIGLCTSTGLCQSVIEKGSVGKIYRGMTVKIVDVETRKTLGVNQKGEICVRGPTVMRSYLGLEDQPFLDDDGFCSTGDLGYFDEDQCLYVVNRLKDVFKHKGIQVCPLELESVLLMHPAVLDACVVGRPAGDIGEMPAAFVVRKSGSSISEREIIDFVSKQVPSHMQLTGGVRFVPELPRNVRRKVLRRRLVEMLG